MPEEYHLINLVEFEKSIIPYGRNRGNFGLILYLGGCSINCLWCNTPQYRIRKEINDKPVKSVFELVQQNYEDIIHISGGEPLEQYQPLLMLIGLILNNYTNCLVEINTSGMVDGRQLKKAFRNKNIRFICDWKPVSSGCIKDRPLYWMNALDEKDDLLFPVSNESDIDDIMRNTGNLNHIKAKKYIVPLYHRLSYEEIIELMYKYKSFLKNYKFSLEIPANYYSKKLYAI